MCAGIDVVQFTIIACVVENRTHEIEMNPINGLGMYACMHV